MRSHARLILWSGAVLSLLIVLYLAFGSFMNVRSIDGPHQRSFRLSTSIAAGIGSLPVLKTAQGDTVTLVVSSDRPGLVHLDGYEKVALLRAGGEVSLTFTASRAGRFGVHVHDPDAGTHGLATLEVDPR